MISKKNNPILLDLINYALKNEKLFDKNPHYRGINVFYLYHYLNKKCQKNDIIFDIDWQGTKQLSKFKELNFVKIFLITNSKDELKNRLIKRNQNTKTEVEKRSNSFEEDIKHWNDYDYIIINKNLDVCFKQIENIIETNKKKDSILSHKDE